MTTLPRFARWFRLLLFVFRSNQIFVNRHPDPFSHTDFFLVGLLLDFGKHILTESNSQWPFILCLPHEITSFQLLLFLLFINLFWIFSLSFADLVSVSGCLTPVSVSLVGTKLSERG